MDQKTDAELFKGIPPRTWVALSADQSRVVATGASYGEAVDAATAAGENDPVLWITQPQDGIRISYFV